MPINIKIKLDDKQKAFYSGEELKGTLSVKDPLRSSFSIRGLSIRLLGVANTFQIQGPYSQLREQDIVVDETVNLTSPDTPIKVTKENHKFPFSFQIPDDLRPTIYINRNNNIRYVLNAGLSTLKSNKVQAEKEIIIATQASGESDSAELVKVFGEIGASHKDTIVTYGDGNYYESGALIERSKEDDFYDTETNGDTPYIIDISNTKVRTHDPNKSMLISKKREWGHDAIYSKNLFMDVVFPSPGIWTDVPLNLSVKCYVDGNLPRLCLTSLKVMLTETTFISAKEISNKERKHHTLFASNKLIDLSTSVEHDFSDMIRANAKFPEGLAPDFDGKTMARSYTMSVHLQFYKGNLEDAEKLGRQVLSARHDVKVYGEQYSKALPRYSYIN